MASDTYWHQQVMQIRYADSPMPENVLIGYGPMFAINDAIALGVIGRADEARSLLSNFFPSLMRLLNEQKAFTHYSEHERLQRLSSLWESAHVAYWLLHRKFDPELGQRAYDSALAYFRMMSPRAKLDSVLVLHLMLYKIEIGQHFNARQLYEMYEHTPIEIPPKSIRFARNPRSLLYAHLRSDEISNQELHLARESFRKAATQWEKDVAPIPYVMRSHAARIFAACLTLIDAPNNPAYVYGLVR